MQKLNLKKKPNQKNLIKNLFKKLKKKYKDKIIKLPPGAKRDRTKKKFSWLKKLMKIKTPKANKKSGTKKSKKNFWRKLKDRYKRLKKKIIKLSPGAKKTESKKK